MATTPISYCLRARRSIAVLQIVAASLLISLTGGCLSLKTYVDPSFRSATYQSLKRPAQPAPLVINVVFQSEGVEKGGVRPVLEKDVTRVLNASRLFTVDVYKTNLQAAQLRITVNNVGDKGAAVGKGIGTGLTFGLAGSEVIDGYVMTAEFKKGPDGAVVTKTYRHAIYSTVGVHSAPAGMEPMSMDAAFAQVIEDMVLNLLRDLQNDNSL